MHKSILTSMIFILFASCEKKESESSLKTAAVLSEYNSLFGADPLPIIFYPPAALCISGNCTPPEYLNLLSQLKYNDQMRSCTSSASCKSLELSVRNCKNPKSYLIYSTEAADELKIQGEAALYERIYANSYNEEALKYYSISCSAFAAPPVLSFSAGICSMQ